MWAPSTTLGSPIHGRTAPCSRREAAPGSPDAARTHTRLPLKARRAERNELEYELLLALEDGGAIEASGYRFERVQGVDEVEVVDRSRIPLHLCKPKPNLGSLQTMYARAGKAPEGTRLGREGPTLDVVELA